MFLCSLISTPIAIPLEPSSEALYDPMSSPLISCSPHINALAAKKIGSPRAMGASPTPTIIGRVAAPLEDIPNDWFFPSLKLFLKIFSQEEFFDKKSFRHQVLDLKARLQRFEKNHKLFFSLPVVLKKQDFLHLKKRLEKRKINKLWKKIFCLHKEGKIEQALNTAVVSKIFQKMVLIFPNQLCEDLKIKMYREMPSFFNLWQEAKPLQKNKIVRKWFADIQMASMQPNDLREMLDFISKIPRDLRAFIFKSLKDISSEFYRLNRLEGTILHWHFGDYTSSTIDDFKLGPIREKFIKWCKESYALLTEYKEPLKKHITEWDFYYFLMMGFKYESAKLKSLEKTSTDGRLC